METFEQTTQDKAYSKSIKELNSAKIDMEDIVGDNRFCLGEI